MPQHENTPSKPGSATHTARSAPRTIAPLAETQASAEATDQRTLGNRIVVRAAGAGDGGIRPAPDRSPWAIVQRHPIHRGAHPAHKQHDKPHSEAEMKHEADQAQLEWATIEAKTTEAVLPTESGETQKLIPELTAFRDAMLVRVEFAKYMAQSPANSGYKQRITQLRDKANGRLGTVEMRVDTQQRAERRAAALSAFKPVPNLLARVEGNAQDAAQLAGKAVSAKTAKEAGALLREAGGDERVAQEFVDQMESIRKQCAGQADLLTKLAAYKSAADSALASIKAAVAAIKRIIKAITDFDEKLKSCEVTLFEAEELLEHERGLVASFHESMDEVINEPEASPENIAALRRLADERLEEARRGVDRAKAELQAAKDAAAGKPAKDAELQDLQKERTRAQQAADLGAQSTLETLAETEALRTLAGDEPALQAFLAKIPDKKTLKSCLETLKAEKLQKWLDDADIGAVKVLALWATVKEAGIKAFVTEIAAGDQMPLLRIFTADDILAMADDTKLGLKKLAGLTLRMNADFVKKLIAGITLAKVSLLLDEFTGEQVSKTTLTAEQWTDLHTKFNAKKLKEWYTDFGEGSLANFLTKFTAAELDAYITLCGAPRFKVLVKDKKLKADALHKYGAAWLKDFTGVGNGAVAHLLAVKTKGNGVISGGHVEATFMGEINRVIRAAPPPPQRNGAVDAVIDDNATFKKVHYQTFRPDGSLRNEGSKTFIKNLVAQQATWKKRGEEAIWSAIRKCTLDHTQRAWSGTSDDGYSFSGFLALDGKSVKTFFPI